MSTKEQSKQRLLGIAAAVIVLLLLVNGFLLYKYLEKSKSLDQQGIELSESNKLRIEMDKQYHQALSELEEMRTGNEELNAIIDQQKAELKEQKERISRLLKNGGSLDRARAELRNLKTQVQEYTAHIEQLKAENESLRGENELLSEKTKSLTSNLDDAQVRNQELTGQKENLEKEKQQLSADKSRLTSTVTFASVVKVDNVSTTGMKTKSSGKAVKKRYAKNVDLLRICFDATENEVTTPGTEQFYVRIINPIGETMAIDEESSGVFTEKSTGEEIRYSSIRELDYDNRSEKLCLDWAPANPTFTRGKYQVEVYNKQYLAGRGEFQLK